MPTLHRTPTCVVDLRTRDHRPAHVHILLNDGREVLVYLEDLTVSSRHRVRTAEIAEAIAWISERAVALIDQFEELQR